ncbi:MAG: DUF4270 domain-containing protein [Flavobacteriaceae bacterium]|nr:DUF4270 domain-containing protein [Flavobacteriaceae bacterium]
MNIKNILPKLGVIVGIIIGFASCEEDFSTIDTNIINENFSTPDTVFDVIAYSKGINQDGTNGVQTNGLSSYQLGIYNDPVYGKSTVNLLSQLTLGPEALNPEFGDCVVLDSVVLYLPFFNTATVEDTITTYEIDSIFGNSPIDISIYESNFFLREFDPNSGFEDPQEYYSNQGSEFEGFLGELLATVEDFTPSNDAIVLSDTVSLAPGLRVNLPIEFFEDKIIANEGEPELLNNSNFREFFRGLYFKVTSDTDNGSLFIFDLADTDDENIGVKLYTSYKDLDEGEGETCETEDVEVLQEETRLFFNAISVNVFENEVPADIISDLTNADTEAGEETLYVRGGEGIISLIELFGDDTDQNGIADQLEDLREEEWLINEANLIFYVDQDRVTGGDVEPERLIIYETKNNDVLADYFIDFTSGQTTVNALTEHLGRLERDSDDNGEFYKIKITQHVSNLINNDSINAPLGLLVTNNVTQLDFQNLKDPIIPTPGIMIEEVPASSIISPEGTVLFGNNTSNTAKKLRLEIYYTEPN